MLSGLATLPHPRLKGPRKATEKEHQSTFSTIFTYITKVGLYLLALTSRTNTVNGVAGRSIFLLCSLKNPPGNFDISKYVHATTSSIRSSS